MLPTSGSTLDLFGDVGTKEGVRKTSSCGAKVKMKTSLIFRRCPLLLAFLRGNIFSFPSSNMILAVGLSYMMSVHDLILLCLPSEKPCHLSATRLQSGSQRPFSSGFKVNMLH